MTQEKTITRLLDLGVSQLFHLDLGEIWIHRYKKLIISSLILVISDCFRLMRITILSNPYGIHILWGVWDSPISNHVSVSWFIPISTFPMSVGHLNPSVGHKLHQRIEGVLPTCQAITKTDQDRRDWLFQPWLKGVSRYRCLKQSVIYEPKITCQGLWRVWEICIQIYIYIQYIYKNQIFCLKKKDRKSKKFVSHWKSDDGWLNADWKPIAGPSKLIIVLHWSIYMDQFVGWWFFSGGTTWACSFFVALPIWWNLMSNWVQYVRNCILHPKKTHFQHNLQVSCKQMATSTFRWKL